MSWQAKRHNRRIWNWHHVPPQNPAKTIPFKMRVNKLDHAAYHQLFQNAATFEDCVAILWRDWWQPYEAAKNFTMKDISDLHQMGISLPKAS